MKKVLVYELGHSLVITLPREFVRVNEIRSGMKLNAYSLKGKLIVTTSIPEIVGLIKTMTENKERVNGEVNEDLE